MARVGSCVSCGGRLPAGARFCPACGAAGDGEVELLDVAEDRAGRPSALVELAPRRRRVGWAAAAVGVAMVAGAVAFGPGDDAAGPATTSSTRAPVAPDTTLPPTVPPPSVAPATTVVDAPAEAFSGSLPPVPGAPAGLTAWLPVGGDRLATLRLATGGLTTSPPGAMPYAGSGGPVARLGDGLLFAKGSFVILDGGDRKIDLADPRTNSCASGYLEGMFPVGTDGVWAVGGPCAFLVGPDGVVRSIVPWAVDGQVVPALLGTYETGLVHAGPEGAYVVGVDGSRRRLDSQGSVLAVGGTTVVSLRCDSGLACFVVADVGGRSVRLLDLPAVEAYQLPWVFSVSPDGAAVAGVQSSSPFDRLSLWSLPGGGRRDVEGILDLMNEAVVWARDGSHAAWVDGRTLGLWRVSDGTLQTLELPWAPNGLALGIDDG